MLKEPTADEERLVPEITASLKTAMSVQPSADFLARVRRRVAEEDARATVGWPAWLSGAAASAPVVLAVLGAVALGRLLPIGRHSDQASTRVAAPTAAPEAPSGVGPRALASVPRHRPEARAVGVLARRPLRRGVGVLVEPGQQDALRRLVELGLGAPTLPPFVVESLDPGAPLPVLRPGALPRFEAEPLEVSSSAEKDQRWEAGGTASDGDEGSDS